MRRQKSRVLILIEFDLTGLLPVFIHIIIYTGITLRHSLSSHRIRLVLRIGYGRIDLRSLRLAILEELRSYLREQCV